MPAETTASSTLATFYRSDSGLDIVVDSGDSFLYRGAVRLSDADSGRQAWFTYEQKDADDLKYVTAVQSSGQFRDASIGFPVGSTVEQWRDISDLVTGWRRKATLAEGEFFWTLELEGIEWNSLALFQDAAVLMVVEHYDDILGFHAPLILFTGWLDQPKVWGDTDKGGWSCSAQGRRKYLKLKSNTPGVIGGELLTGDITASPQLLDLAAEPTEARYTSDFSIQNVLDEYSGTVYASLDPPATAQLTGGPTGTVTEVPINNGPTPTSGQGLRITMIYAHPAETGAHVRQEQQFVCVYNNTQVDPSVGFEESGRDELQWGNIDITKFQLVFGGGRTGGTIETLDGGKWRSVYLGSKNGGPAPPIILRPHTGAVLCYDEKVFRSQFSVPEGWPIVEYKNCDGYLRGENPFLPSRGAGLGMVLDPDGDWVALRAGPRWADDTRFSGNLSADNGTTIVMANAGYTEPGGGGVTVTTMVPWPADGYVRNTETNRYAYYGTKDDGTLTLSNLSRPLGGTTIAGGTNFITLFQDTAHWDDFVAFGDILDKIPWDFPRGNANDEDTANQNRSGFVAEQPWGVWTNVGGYVVASAPIDYDEGGGNIKGFRRPGPYSPDDWASVSDAAKVAPVVPLLQAIRRTVMGGGVLQEGDGGNNWFDHDSNSAADWAVMTSPRIGNAEEISSSLYVLYHVAEHNGGTVLEDNSDVNDADGSISTQPGEATQWPPALTNPKDAFMRAVLGGGGIVDFIYTSRTDSAFEGVTKLPGFTGIEIDADSELVSVINTKPNWHHSGANAYVQRNMPCLAGISLRRSADLADAEMVTHDRGAGTVTVKPGQAAGFPTAGTIVLYQPGYVDPQSPGITITPVNFAGPYTVDYTGRTNTEFTGCTFPDRVWVAPSTRVRMTGSTINYPSEMDILVSKANDPVDPETFLDSNPSWDVAYKWTHGSQRSAPHLPPGVIDKFFPTSLPPYGFVQWVYIRVRKTTDDRRLLMNTLRFHRTPRQSSSSAFDAGNADSWAGTIRTSTLVHDLLVDASVPHTLIAASGGEGLRSLPIAEGSVWETCRQLALMSNCLLGETADGYLLFVRDPRASGAPYRSLPRLSFTPEAIWGAIRAEERPRNVTSQVIYEARNPGAEEHYSIFVPPHPLPYGQVRRITDRLATSEQAAEMAGRLAFRRSNSGWVFSVPTGQIASDLEPGDILRLAADVDEADRYFSTDCILTSYEETGKTKNDSMTVTVQLEELVTP